ncbi:MAG: ribose-phosphate pyrophosphokinase-like domain-containing protein [Christensenellales bacterium]
MTHGTVKIFAGNGCPDLAKAIADRLELPLGQLEATRFSDGEICVNIKTVAARRFRVRSALPNDTMSCSQIDFNRPQQADGGYALFRLCETGQESARERPDNRQAGRQPS